MSRILASPRSRQSMETKSLSDSTERAVRDFQTAHKLQPTGVVNENTATAINAAVNALQPTTAPEPEPKPDPLVVKGRITQADGGRVAGATVRAFDKDMRAEQPLGQAVTDKNGNYEIEYTAAQFGRTEKG